MTSGIIQNKADFQRHLNGCEQRLNDLKKSLETIEKSTQQVLIKKSSDNRINYFNQLNAIITEMKFLYSSISILDQSIFVSNGNKRLDLLKTNLEKFRQKFHQIQQYAHMKFGYEYSENQFEDYTTEQQEQLVQLIEKNTFQEQIELDLLSHHMNSVNHIEKDIVDLHGAFRDLDRIIHDQGTMVNNIEQALTNTDEMIIEAKENVRQTVQTARRTRHWKWIIISIICFVILILILVLILILKFSFIY